MNIGFYSAMMLGVYALLPQSEKDELHEWEKIHNGLKNQFRLKYVGRYGNVTVINANTVVQAKTFQLTIFFQNILVELSIYRTFRHYVEVVIVKREQKFNHPYGQTTKGFYV